MLQVHRLFYSSILKGYINFRFNILVLKQVSRPSKSGAGNSVTAVKSYILPNDSKHYPSSVSS
jgi:hypothetical protein